MTVGDFMASDPEFQADGPNIKIDNRIQIGVNLEVSLATATNDIQVDSKATKRDLIHEPSEEEEKHSSSKIDKFALT